MKFLMYYRTKTSYLKIEKKKWRTTRIAQKDNGIDLKMGQASFY